MSISLTKAAADRIANQLSKNNAHSLRFGANESGCSGFSYKMEFADQVESDDITFESYGVNVLIDPRSLEILDGTVIDYVSEGLNQTFRFSNPKASAHCGCGESFAVDANQ